MIRAFLGFVLAIAFLAAVATAWNPPVSHADDGTRASAIAK